MSISVQGQSQFLSRDVWGSMGAAGLGKGWRAARRAQMWPGRLRSGRPSGVPAGVRPPPGEGNFWEQLELIFSGRLGTRPRREAPIAADWATAGERWCHWHGDAGGFSLCWERSGVRHGMMLYLDG